MITKLNGLAVDGHSRYPLTKFCVNLAQYHVKMDLLRRCLAKEYKINREVVFLVFPVIRYFTYVSADFEGDEKPKGKNQPLEITISFVEGVNERDWKGSGAFSKTLMRLYNYQKVQFLICG